ncbi:MAG TPA: hypothetical protein VFA65_24435 [Bryobacteraceae bacterium]|nr:hypothetical protein [Bryobacteraceae bacterium]
MVATDLWQQKRTCRCVYGMGETRPNNLVPKEWHQSQETKLRIAPPMAKSYWRYGSAESGGSSYLIISELEPQTRKIMLAMGGEQPSENDWSIFFMRSGGSMSGAICERMEMAHNVAKSQSAKQEG